jgi:hypothetical protein
MEGFERFNKAPDGTLDIEDIGKIPRSPVAEFYDRTEKMSPEDKDILSEGGKYAVEVQQLPSDEYRLMVYNRLPTLIPKLEALEKIQNDSIVKDVIAEQITVLKEFEIEEDKRQKNTKPLK